MEKIDFVITWLDSSDKKWQNDFNKYSTKKISESRYRDWDFLKYWFRSIEQNAPWVNKIYFVTYGHVPKWLNINNEKLVIVNHEDYIPSKYLPTFNSCVLEINFNNIKDLSNKFVYFNDDMFLNDIVTQEDFFVDGKPLDNMNVEKQFFYGKNSSKINYNCGKIINNYFNIKEAKKRFSIKDYIKIVLSFTNKPINVLTSTHMPTSFLKKTFDELWNKESKKLLDINKNKFRTNNDVSQWLFEYWQIASDNYVERSQKDYKYYDINDLSIDDICNDILNKKSKFICMNDGEATNNYIEYKKKIIDALENRYNSKSSFEV